MQYAGVRRSRQLAIVACLGIGLAGCTTRQYFVADVPVEFADEEHDALFSKVKTLEPGALADKSPVERQLTFYSGKKLVTGSFLRTEPERLDVTVRSGWIISAHRNIQMILVSGFFCGNISGHGDFCGTSRSYRCEMWGSHTLRKSCPIMPPPTAAERAEAARAAPFIQSATVHTAPLQTVHRSAGDPVATGAPQK